MLRMSTRSRIVLTTPRCWSSKPIKWLFCAFYALFAVAIALEVGVSPTAEELRGPFPRQPGFGNEGWMHYVPIGRQIPLMPVLSTRADGDNTLETQRGASE